MSVTLFRLRRGIWRACVACVVLLFCLLSLRLMRRATGGLDSSTRSLESTEVEARFPLVFKYIHSFNQSGGAWYIPPEWIAPGDSPPKTILDAARLASDAASRSDARMFRSNVPLIVHQTSASARADTWNRRVFPWVEKWLAYSLTPRGLQTPIAYFFWDDEGVFELVSHYENWLLGDFSTLFSPVERADIFRILVCKVFGGVYADVDTEPLRHPATWIDSSDMAAWVDSQTGKMYGVDVSGDDQRANSSIDLLLGLEADTNPATDAGWRMGYKYPVQLTQWALASAPEHPVLERFMRHIAALVEEMKTDPAWDPRKADPLARTGPEAITKATSTWLEETVATFRWNSVSGLQDNGKSKLVSDVLVLPITAFSPGRGRYGNMGSKPVDHPDARLRHHAVGSWRHFNLAAEYGKLCRTVFGLCRDWGVATS